MSKRNCISLEQKRLIIIEVEKGVKKKKEIAAQFGIPSNTLSTILKNKAQLLKQSDGEQLGSNRKRVRTCLYEDVDEAMLNWTVAARKRNIPLTGPIMKERAKDVAEALGHLEFEASAGWLDKFKKRHGIVEKTFCGDCASIKVPDKWFKKVLPNLIHKYDKNDIFKGLPNKTLAFKDEKCFGGKKSKEKITFRVTCNMTDSDEDEPHIDLVHEHPTIQRTKSAVEVLRKFVGITDNVPDNVFASLYVLEDFVEKEMWRSQTQTKITNYFK